MIDNVSGNHISAPYRTESDKQIKVNEIVPISGEDTARSPKKEEFVNRKDIEKIVKSINQFLEPSHTSLKFEFHEKLREYYVSVVDDRTKEVIKEIPPKKLLDFYAEMTEFAGLLIDKKI